MKTVYFVRHGESESNAGSVQKGGDSALTEKGRGQARLVAERCAHLPCDLLVASTLRRATETAGVIGQKIEKDVESSDLFVERRRASEQIDLSKTDPLWLEIEKSIYDNYSVPGYHYSDEENFEDLRERANEAWTYLERRSEENIIVVTHGMFMRIMTACAVMGPDVAGVEGEMFVNKFHTANTGITIFKHDEQSRRTPWFLWVWNDQAHLAE